MLGAIMVVRWNAFAMSHSSSSGGGSSRSSSDRGTILGIILKLGVVGMMVLLFSCRAEDRIIVQSMGEQVALHLQFLSFFVDGLILTPINRRL